MMSDVRSKKLRGERLEGKKKEDPAWVFLLYKLSLLSLNHQLLSEAGAVDVNHIDTFAVDRSLDGLARFDVEGAECYTTGGDDAYLCRVVEA